MAVCIHTGGIVRSAAFDSLGKRQTHPVSELHRAYGPFTTYSMAGGCPGGGLPLYKLKLIIHSIASRESKIIEIKQMLVAFS